MTQGDVDQYPTIDVTIDGTDECVSLRFSIADTSESYRVDRELNCIKGGGACLFQEKLVAERARKFVCVAGMYCPKDEESQPLTFNL